MQTEPFGGQTVRRSVPSFPVYEVGAAQWQGTRDKQNDVLWTTPPDEPMGMAVALADGIGTGWEAGAAAEAVVDAMARTYFSGSPEEEPHHMLLRMIGSAHEQVRSMNSALRQRGEATGGAAVACVLIRGMRASVASVGNVRVFLYRAGMLLQLNRDHLLSLAAEERSLLGGEEPELRPDWTMTVTAYAGMEGLSTVDYTQAPLRLMPSDRLVLMSSGLYGVFPEGALCRILDDPRAQSAADRLIARMRAECHQSQSNASIIVLKVNRQRRTQARMAAQ
ncbi:MAG: PP2C family protein-serine/threonine phosphatase [Aristaeellaceae bacterium]